MWDPLGGAIIEPLMSKRKPPLKDGFKDHICDQSYTVQAMILGEHNSAIHSFYMDFSLKYLLKRTMCHALHSTKGEAVKSQKRSLPSCNLPFIWER